MIPGGMPDEPGAGRSHPSNRSLSLVQREVALIVVLCAVAVVMFVATRWLAGWSRDTSRATALMWHDRGRDLLAGGQTPEGLAALRKAVAADRNATEFNLALARALRAAGQDEEAWQILLRLRQQEPEDAEINYRLGRLAAARGELDLAVRYYNHALYGIDPGASPIDRQQVLAELAGLLLDRDDRESASGVLTVLARDVPDTPEAHLNLARLYVRAGEHGPALAQYAAVLARRPGDVVALAEAAEAAFAIGDFAGAEQHLVARQKAGSTGPDLDRRLALVRTIVRRNPMAGRLEMTERVRRLVAGLDRAAGRLAACRPASADPSDDELRAALQAFRRQRGQDLRDTDVLASGVGLIGRVEAFAAARCGASDLEGEAWKEIARAGRTAR
jgi:Flp pilus assembly protein TadD